MLDAAIAFLPFAAFLAVLPGPATAMVIQSAARGGRARAMRATRIVRLPSRTRASVVRRP
jgi:threonine/homoserine/homoserine lactone efflux protein